MTNKELADLIYPNITKTIDDYEKIYPERNLKEGAVVSRFAPSPTGFVHMGSLLASFIESFVPKTTGGVFYLRIEDTDGKRSVENGISGIIKDLKEFEIEPDEGVISEVEEKGIYGPYIQSNRKEIYDTFIKHLICEGLAYPCFCNEEELDNMRKTEEQIKTRIGYYGSWAKCRDLSNEERAERIKRGEEFVIRLKSPGKFENKVVLKDLVRGEIVMPENDIDIVISKRDGLPTYHFAHLVDDHLMRTTHVLRGEEWVPSYPIHHQLFQIFGFKEPKYAHLGLVMKIDGDGSRRKLSKRKDPEAAVSYYHEKGIPVDAVKLYLMTIANSNFEAWMDSNPDKKLEDFKFDFKKMSASGSLFDVDKMLNISKNYISKLSATEVYENVLSWSLEFDKEFYDLLVKYKDESIKIFNIEREQKKPRKDYSCYSEIRNQVWYMYDELFDKENRNYDFGDFSIDEVKNILKVYIDKYYLESDDKDTWFDKIKCLADEFEYAKEVKEYKQNPDNYKGHVGDVSMFIRICITTKTMTPDLYEIMKILGKDRLEKRINNFIENY